MDGLKRKVFLSTLKDDTGREKKKRRKAKTRSTTNEKKKMRGAIQHKKKVVGRIMGCTAKRLALGRKEIRNQMILMRVFWEMDPIRCSFDRWINPALPADC
jgi:hypothetical protein